MDDSRLPSTQGRRIQPTRPQTERPPIEWPVNRTQTDNERAANIARNRLNMVYQKEGEPNQATNSLEASETQDQNIQTAQPIAMRDEPYDWQKYHNAWQQYYHQYFYRYYAGWWQQQKAQLENEVNKQAALGPAEPSVSENERIASELRKKIRANVQRQATKVKSSSHFKPLLAAFSVGAAFLLINYNQVLVGAIKQYVSPGSVVTTPVIVEPNTLANVGPEPKIIIPKIGVDAPVVYDEPKVDESSYQKALERGVVRLGTTANPGTKGNVVIGGHSSNNVFNAGKYKYVFVNLRRMESGDIFYLNYDSKRYTYKVTLKKVITPTDVSALAQTSTPTVTLFTCDPPGTNVNRLIIQAEQIDPSPTSAKVNNNQATKVNGKNPLPSVAPSLWDRIFGN